MTSRRTIEYNEIEYAKELLKVIKKHFKIKGRLRVDEIQYENELSIYNGRIKLKTKDDVWNTMIDIRKIATYTNFNYAYGESNAYAGIKDDEYYIHFDAPRASNGDNSYYSYPQNFGFYITFKFRIE